MATNTSRDENHIVNLSNGKTVLLKIFLNTDNFKEPDDEKAYAGLVYSIHDMYLVLGQFPRKGMQVKCGWTGKTYQVERVRYDPRSPADEESKIVDAQLVFFLIKQ